MLGLTILFLGYELYIHENPKVITVIDLLYNKLPLFTQRKFMKRALIIWLALIRSYYIQKKSEEDVLLAELKKDKS